MEQQIARSCYKPPFFRGFWAPIWNKVQPEKPLTDN